MSLLAAVMPNYDIPCPSQEAALRLECWYHGMLTRLRSEYLVRSEGDFLVRDSISSKGDFVLTVFWNGHAVHFQINKDPAPAATSSTGFLFQTDICCGELWSIFLLGTDHTEKQQVAAKRLGQIAECEIALAFEEEQFENVSDLITFYQTHRKPITRNSGCIITNPVPNTTTTITADEIGSQNEIEQNYMKIFRPQLFKCGQERSLSQKVLLNETRKQLQLKVAAAVNSPLPSSPVSTMSNGKPHLSLSDLLSRPLPEPAHSPIKEDQDEYCEMDYDAMEDTTAATATATASSASTLGSTATLTGGDDEVLDASTSNLDLLLDRKLSLTSLNSLNSSSTTVITPTTSASCQDITKLHWRLPRAGSAPALPKRKFPPRIRDSGCVADSADYDQPRITTTATRCGVAADACTSSAIDVLNYRSPLIEPNSKPQTPQQLQKFRELLLGRKPEDCARLITVEDCRLLRLGGNLKNTPKCHHLNGLSLILLPHGQNVRNDLLERSRSLRYLCILSILHQVRSEERIAVYDAWIQISRALLYHYGNAFSFLTLTVALCSDLLKCVAKLRNEENSQKEELESKLRPLANKLLHCERIPENCPKIRIPFMQPLLDLLSNQPSNNFLDTKTFSGQADSLWNWLEEGRNWIKKQSAAELEEYSAKLQQGSEAISHSDNFLCTEFSLKLLFGSKGCTADAPKRYDNLAAVGAALAERCSL